MPELSIVIVNYKNQHLIAQCVQSILDCEQTISYEIIVVDNDSQDNTEAFLKKLCPAVRWFQMGYNSGFGRANNIGIQAATGSYLLLLNSDVIVKDLNTLRSCVNYLTQLPNSIHTILGTRLVNPDGSYQETLRLSFPGIMCEIHANPLYILIAERLLKREYKDADKEQQRHAHYRSGQVAWINGAFLLMHRSTVIEKHLLFDEDFFLYGEDVEWCWRARKQGMHFHHWHEQELVHIGSASSFCSMVKHKQVMASDWLYIRKTRGVCVFMYDTYDNLPESVT